MAVCCIVPSVLGVSWAQEWGLLIFVSTEPGTGKALDKHVVSNKCRVWKMTSPKGKTGEEAPHRKHTLQSAPLQRDTAGRTPVCGHHPRQKG